MSGPEFPVGVVGAGFHASTNILPAIRAAGLDVVALATRDRDRSAAALAANGFRGTPYGSAGELLGDPAVPAVIVVAQPADQIELVLAAIRAGKAVFVDKPLGRSADEAARIADAAEAAGVDIAICTDNAGLHNVRLPWEYENLLTQDVIDFDQLIRCQDAAFRHAFAWPHPHPPRVLLDAIVSASPGIGTPEGMKHQ